MNLINSIITIALIVLVACAGLGLLIRQLALKRSELNNTPNIGIKVCDLIIQVFLILHIPLLLIKAIFATMDIFVYLNGTYQMLNTIIIAVFVIILERFIEHLQFHNSLIVYNEYQPNNTAVFAYIDMYREIENINLELLKQIKNSESGILSQFNENEALIKSIMDKIDSYLLMQNNECQLLLTRKNSIFDMLNALSNKAAGFNYEFGQFDNKLKNAGKALHYYENSESLIVDIKESFSTRYKQSANELIKRIDDTEQQLKKIVDEFTGLNDYIQPHMQKINVYNIRIDTVLQSLKESRDNKYSMLENTSTKIAETVNDAGKNLNETLGYLNLFLQRNSFVLKKILESYEENPAAPHELKDIIKNWPAAFEAK